ncbi:membrane protein [Streptomyces noursei ZPM]|uniref:Uncharacterized protein n=1 Tax=Streptomyces noursei TaxID=1971 RepID=A0A401R4S9_STRNR|nr:hypothetical protein [Streptomyces noursei]AKA05128.1 membrane protein [Streptomyces noursei ZPM]EOT05771.1 hypothetical protein K530_01867 [Streptomyces noursei CCRC 11814]EXU91545.1 membrane protein [Streptomyces noursei PD-1]UWS73522.1 hypothetical protein N1H47_21095 [Streptomyces noursei]GCB92569.1 hypothetical protein SALB_05336 [Streptomyces noursei]
MELNISAVPLLGVVLVVMIRGKSLKAGPAVVAVLFGFFLADTGAAPDIHQFMASVAGLIDGVRF